MRIEKTKTISLRLITADDAEFIVSLRQSPKKNQFLSPVSINVDQQAEWIHHYKRREAQKLEYYFIICTGNTPVGVVRIYDIQDINFVWGSWIIADCAPKYAAIESALSIYEFAFNELGFATSTFDVRKQNTRVLSFHQRFGAIKTHEDDLNEYFYLTRAIYLKTKERYQKFFLPR